MARRKNRYRVNIRCNKCGEKYLLKGIMKKGKLETGFKRCICDNESDFEMETEKLP